MHHPGVHVPGLTQSRIEGSTIIIACSIPILQPLLEKVLRRNPFASSNKRSKPVGRYYEDYTDTPSGYQLGSRKARSRPKDDLGLTIVADGGSEEEILGPGGAGYPQQHQTAYAVADGQFARDGQTQRGQQIPAAARASNVIAGKIVKTDTVTVTYDEEAQTGGFSPPRNAPHMR